MTQCVLVRLGSRLFMFGFADDGASLLDDLRVSLVLVEDHCVSLIFAEGSRLA